MSKKRCCVCGYLSEKAVKLDYDLVHGFLKWNWICPQCKAARELKIPEVKGQLDLFSGSR